MTFHGSMNDSKKIFFNLLEVSREKLLSKEKFVGEKCECAEFCQLTRNFL